MKITFEGPGIQDIYDQMEALLASTNMSRRIKASMVEKSTTNSKSVADEIKDEIKNVAQGPGPEASAAPKAAPDKTGDKPAEKSGDKSEIKERMAKMRAVRDANKAAKAAADAAAGAKPVDKKAPKPKPAPEPEAPEENADLFSDPAEVAKNRAKTIEDLQQAYANGHQKEVFELLSRFGNGAKSFRELPPEAFLPIREAIDKGALT